MSPELGDSERDIQALNLLCSFAEFGIEVPHERMRDARDATISNPVYRWGIRTAREFPPAWNRTESVPGTHSLRGLIWERFQ